jgi:hypothetical protein
MRIKLSIWGKMMTFGGYFHAFFSLEFDFPLKKRIFAATKLIRRGGYEDNHSIRLIQGLSCV